jgi:hypothetical protein
LDFRRADGKVIGHFHRDGRSHFEMHDSHKRSPAGRLNLKEGSLPKALMQKLTRSAN